jgi:hypothetical protein
MRIRIVEATIVHTESQLRESKIVNILLDDRAEQFVIAKVWVVEFNRSLIFDKETNELLIPD